MVQGGDSAVHAEQSVGDNQTSRRGVCCRQLLVERIKGVLVVDSQPGTTEPATVDQARVIEPVAEDRVAWSDQGSDGAQVGSESRWEQ